MRSSGLAGRRSDLRPTWTTRPNAGNAGNYTVDQTVDITCTAADEPNGSGLASTTCHGISSPATSFALGARAHSAVATDKAGNVGNGSASFGVSVDVASLGNVITELVPDAGTASSLKSEVTAIGSAPNAKAKAGKLNAMVNHGNALTGEKIDPASATLLTRLASALYAPVTEQPARALDRGR